MARGSSTPETDVVIIGMGAVGGIAASVLTEAGLEVVGIEAGPHLTEQDFLRRLDELGESSSLRNRLGSPKFNREIPTYRPDSHSPNAPQSIVSGAGMANCVGGTSVHYGTQSWRFHEDDFTIRSSTIAKYGKGVMPAGASVVDWPLTYKELEPYYDKVEYQIGVSGQAGSNPFEAPRSRPYPMPALRQTGYSEMVAAAARGMGLHPFPQPAAILSEIYDDRPPCTYCGFCGTGFGCWNGSRSSTLVSSIPAAEKTGNLTLLTNSRVMKILVDSSGRASGVEYVDEKGHRQVQRAKFVILGSFVFENVRLLLLSRSKAYPKGLSNNHGQVGRYFTPQVVTQVSAFHPGKALNLWAGSGGQTIVIDDYDADNFDHKGVGFIRGASGYVLNESLPIGHSTAVPPGQRLWGSSYKRWLHEDAGSIGGVLIQQESVFYETNYLDLDPVVKDEMGVPVVRITYSSGENEAKMAEYMTEKFGAILKAAGAKETWSATFPITPHSYGGTRMGDDPGSFVVDKYSVSHEVPNLAVFGGSTFCSTSGFNPTETMQALAWYGAEHIAENFESLTA